MFFAGEKSLDPAVYYTGNDGADNDTCLEGNDWDVNRWVATEANNNSHPIATRAAKTIVPPVLAGARRRGALRLLRWFRETVELLN